MSRSKSAKLRMKQNEKTEEEQNSEIISGISSAHSWCKVGNILSGSLSIVFLVFKAMTMVRPKTLGEEKEDSEEEEEEIQIVLTSKDPNETSGLIR